MSNPKSISIPIVLLEEAKIPSYASDLAAGADVCACIAQDMVIQPGESALIPTGLKVAIPEGFEIQVRPRSGLAFKNKITVINTPGTIDADYRGEIGVILINHGREPFVVMHGMRIAQLVVAPVVQACFIPRESLSATVRGEGGFGHTGVL
jgi:dUTP pyrophosphatase